jgi:hypothetical protein
MSDNENCLPSNERTSWNKGKLIGARPPLRPSTFGRSEPDYCRRGKYVTLFNLAIDSKLRGSDVVAVRVEDVAPNGYAMDRATVTPASGQSRRLKHPNLLDRRWMRNRSPPPAAMSRAKGHLIADDWIN